MKKLFFDWDLDGHQELVGKEFRYLGFDKTIENETGLYSKVFRVGDIVTLDMIGTTSGYAVMSQGKKSDNVYLLDMYELV